MDNQFLLVYHRRAFERIVYDQTIQNFMVQLNCISRTFVSNRNPIEPKGKHLWDDNEKILRQLGMNWDFEGVELKISSVPSILSEDKIESFINKIIHQLEFSTIEKGELAHYFVLALSKAASQQDKVLGQQENCKALIEQLLQCEDF